MWVKISRAVSVYAPWITFKFIPCLWFQTTYTFFIIKEKQKWWPDSLQKVVDFRCCRNWWSCWGGWSCTGVLFRLSSSNHDIGLDWVKKSWKSWSLTSQIDQLAATCVPRQRPSHFSSPRATRSGWVMRRRRPRSWCDAVSEPWGAHSLSPC